MKKRFLCIWLGLALLLSACSDKAEDTSSSVSSSTSSDSVDSNGSVDNSYDDNSYGDNSFDDIDSPGENTANNSSYSANSGSGTSSKQTNSESAIIRDDDSKKPIEEDIPLEPMTASVEKLFAVSNADKKITYNSDTVYRFDLRSVIDTANKEKVSEKIQYDTINLIVSIQGIVNRDKPRLYIDFLTNSYEAYNIKPMVTLTKTTDEYWFDYLTASGGYLNGKTVVKVESVGKIVELFRSLYGGAVVWDSSVSATSNVASTIAGVEDLLPMRYDEELGVYDWFVRRHGLLAVKRNLRGMFTGKGLIPDTKLPTTGSKKCDAYVWALEKYLKTGKTNKTRMCGLVDAYSKRISEIKYGDMEDQALTNRDYYIAERCFFWDLCPWPDMIPNDDLTQMSGTDYKTLQKILTAQNKRADGEITTVGTFAPFKTKYCHEAGISDAPNAVQNEWQYINLLSTYYCQVDTEQAGIGAGCITNLSIMRKYPLKTSYKQNDKTPKTTTLGKKNYICFYNADADSSQYIGKGGTTLVWDDPKRGEIPIAWSFNTDMAERVPHALDYMYSTKTANDYFVATNNATGYFQASSLLSKNRPAGLNGTADGWVSYAKRQIARWDIDIGGLYIDYDDMDWLISKYTYGNESVAEKVNLSQGLTDLYSRITPTGSAFNYPPAKSSASDGSPCIWNINPYNPLCDAQYAAWQISLSCKNPASNVPGFLWCRMIFLQPTIAVEIQKILNTTYASLNVEIVDPYTFFALYKKAIA